MKIRYIISHGVAEWVDFDVKDKEEMTFVFEPRYSGTLTLGDDILAVKNGEVTFPLGEIHDGKYTPRLECEVGAVAVCGFIKSGRSVAMAESHGRTVRALIRECYELSVAKEDLERRVTQLETLCKGHDIFNFERTQA